METSFRSPEVLPRRKKNLGKKPPPILTGFISREITSGFF
jgi:hypothetical protein